MKYLIFLLISYSLLEAVLTKKSFLNDVVVDNYSQISQEEFTDTKELFYKIFNQQTPYKTEMLNIKKIKSYISVKEKVATGGGAFLFNNGAKKILLQMPHCKFDKYTCNIGMKLFLENDYKGASFSTTHRYTTQYSDLAHTRYSKFTAQAWAFAKSFKNGILVQLHGFGKDLDTDIIISSGDKKISKKASTIAQCFKKNGFDTKLYGKEIYTLGGTTNSSNRVLKSLDHDGFIHIELSLQQRKSLLKSKKRRGEFSKCINIF